MEISDLNANLQEQGLIIAALRDELRKLKGKSIVDNNITTHTIDLEMLKVDVEPIAPRLLNNRADNSVSNQSAPSFDQYFELNELKAQSQEKDTVISKLKDRMKSLSGNVNKDKEQGLIIAALREELRKLKGKYIVDNNITTHTIDPEMLKVDVEPIAPRLLNNRAVHSNYLRLT
nr:hypothetical protein [Tanacetum cinerariifolium]